MDSANPGRLERLLREHAALVRALARAYTGLGVPLEDLLSEGRVGLLEAARRWDRSRGVPFGRYAVWWIRRQVLRALRRQGCLLVIPDGDWRRMHGDAERLDPEARIPKPRWFSLSAPLDPGDEDSGPIRLADPRAVDPGERCLRREARRRLRSAVDRLPERERRVIRWKYGFDSEEPGTLADAARHLGVSRERARQIEGRARRRLREWLQAGPDPRPAA